MKMLSAEKQINITSRTHLNTGHLFKTFSHSASLLSLHTQLSPAESSVFHKTNQSESRQYERVKVKVNSKWPPHQDKRLL